MQMRDGREGWDPEATPAFWVNWVSRGLLRRFDARLRPFGFAMSYLPVLHALASGKALSQAQLAAAARVEQPSMAETLARMERDGVVQREPCPDDRRRSLVSVTRRARARLPGARAALSEVERAALVGFTDAEARQLREMLERVARNLEAMDENQNAETPR